MPNFSVYVDDDTHDWLEENIGKGNISPYIQGLILSNKNKVILAKEISKLGLVADAALGIIGFSFIVFVFGSKYFPEYSSGLFSAIMILGGLLLLIVSAVKIKDRKRDKNGTTNTSVVN